MFAPPGRRGRIRLTSVASWREVVVYFLFISPYVSGPGLWSTKGNYRRWHQTAYRARAESDCCRWLSSGGLWVSEFEVDQYIVHEFRDKGFEAPVPAILGLARTMDEKCEILKERFDAKYYSNISEYKGLNLQNSVIEQPETPRPVATFRNEEPSRLPAETFDV